MKPCKYYDLIFVLKRTEIEDGKHGTDNNHNNKLNKINKYIYII